MNIYLDDIRNPVGDGWSVCRNGDEFRAAVTAWCEAKRIGVCAVYPVACSGCPGTIGCSKDDLTVSFDHDLGDGCADDGYSLVKWLCDYLMEFCGTTIIALVDVRVHSANPVGRDNIEKYWDWFRRHCV